MESRAFLTFCKTSLPSEKGKNKGSKSHARMTDVILMVMASTRQAAHRCLCIKNSERWVELGVKGHKNLRAAVFVIIVAGGAYIWKQGDILPEWGNAGACQP